MLNRKHLSLHCAVLLLTSCYLLKPSAVTSYEKDEYYRHLASLEVAFERELYLNASYYNYLEKRTQHIHTLSNLSEEERLLLQRYHRKLKSIIAYFNLASGIVDTENILQDTEEAILLQEMLRANVRSVDPTKATEFPYSGENKERQAEFYRLLLNKALQSTQQSIARYRHMFPFLLQATEQNSHPKQEQPTYDANTLTKAINIAIHSLNHAKAEIENMSMSLHGKSTKVDFTHPEVRTLIQDYELQMGELADKHLLPLFFTTVFRKKSGSIGFERNLLEKLMHKSKMLNSVTVQITTDCANDLLRMLISYEQELKQKLQGNLKMDAHASNWIISNELLAAQTLVQYPQYIPISLYISSKSTDNSRNILRYLLKGAGLITLGAMVYAALPLSAGSTALITLKRAVMISNIANLGWLGLSITDALQARNHRLFLERSLMIGSSNRVSNGLKLLRKFEQAREWAIFSVFKNVTMISMPIGTVMRGVHNSMKEDVEKFLKKHVNAD